MRIAFLTTEYITESNFAGGLANYLYRVATALKYGGHDVQIFVLTDRNECINYDGITVWRVKRPHLDSIITKRFKRLIDIIAGSYVLKKAVLKQHKVKKIDIVQVANYLSPGYFLARSRAIPIVTRVSSFAPFWRAVNGQHSYLEDIIAERLELLQMRESQGVYAPSKILCDYINMYEPIHIDEIKPPYIDVCSDMDCSLFNVYAKDLDYLLFYGSMLKLKGFHFILRNLKKILFENEKIHFIFIGRYGKEVEIKEMAGSFRDRVLYLDSMRMDKLRPFIIYARAVILPSRIDNLANTCLESMALGKVIVTTHTSGFKDIIFNGINGFLIEYGKDNELCSVVKKICSMTDIQLKNIGMKAREVVLDKFSAQKNINLLIKYFENSINNWKHHTINKR